MTGVFVCLVCVSTVKKHMHACVHVKGTLGYNITEDCVLCAGCHQGH